MIVLSELIPVLIWLVLIFLLHIPLLSIFRKYLPLIAVPLSLSLGVLLFTLVSFWITLFHLPLNLSIIPFLGIIIMSWYSDQNARISEIFRSVFSHIRDGWRYYLLFVLTFLFMLLIRVYSPDISSAEKFMDHGFIASIMRSPMIPPLDPWFAGGDLSVYYYLGHWMLAAMGLITGTPSNILFTLALPTIAALSAVNLYGVGHLLLPRFRLLPALFLLLINPAFFLLALKGTEWGTLLWNSTRVIDSTINEYPLFSYIFGDVHAHVIGFLPQTTLILLVIAALLYWKTAQNGCRLLIILSSGLVLGTIPPVNTWDILIHAPLILITGIILCISALSLGFGRDLVIRFKNLIPSLQSCLWIEKREIGLIGLFSPIRGAMLYLCAIPVIGIVSYLPFYLMMKTQGIKGIGIVSTPSSIQSFLLVNGWFLALICVSLLPIFRKKPWLLLFALPFICMGYYAAAIGVILLAGIIARHDGPADILAGAGLFILIFCELIYLKDSMGDQYYRMNTVFKLYLGAWLLLSASAAVFCGRILIILSDRMPGSIRPIKYLIAITLFLLLLVPGYVTMTHAGPYTPTLNGLAWLSVYHPDDQVAVNWLASLPGSHTLIEAENGDYTYFSRVSSFTGIPSLIGWPFHEVMWRNDTPSGWYGERTSALRSIYEVPEKTIPLMKKYKADLLYVGPSEMERYKVELPTKGLKQIFHHGAVTIYTAV